MTLQVAKYFLLPNGATITVRVRPLNAPWSTPELAVEVQLNPKPMTQRLPEVERP